MPSCYYFFFFVGSLLSESVEVHSQKNRLEEECKHFLLFTALNNIFRLLMPSLE